MANHHILKTDTAAFDAVQRGDKNFEVRRDDRMFQAGDTLTLERYNGYRQTGVFAVPPASNNPKHKPIDACIGFVMRGGQYGVKTGFVVLALKDIQQHG